MPDENVNDLPKGPNKKLPKYAKLIYKKAHDSALSEYKDPKKRRDNESKEVVAHKVAWAAVKKKYKKENDDWVEK